MNSVNYNKTSELQQVLADVTELKICPLLFSEKKKNFPKGKARGIWDNPHYVVCVARYKGGVK